MGQGSEVDSNAHDGRICEQCGGLHIRNREEIKQWTMAYLEHSKNPCHCQECGCSETYEVFYNLAKKRKERPEEFKEDMFRIMERVQAKRSQKHR